MNASELRTWCERRRYDAGRSGSNGLLEITAVTNLVGDRIDPGGLRLKTDCRPGGSTRPLRPRGNDRRPADLETRGLEFGDPR